MKTETEHKTTRQSRTLFLVSLLIHLLILFLLFFNAFRQRNKLALANLLKKQEQQARMQAALLPKKSDEGTLVVFDDSTILPPPPAEEPKKVAQNKPQVPKKKAQPSEEEPTAKEEIKKEIIDEQSPIPELEKASGTPEEVTPEEIAEEQPEQVEEEPSITIPIDIARLAVNNLLKEQTKPSEEKKPQERQPVVRKKKEKNLLSLSRCFLDHAKGTSALMRHGENRFPELEEMKYICYEKQIEEHIIATWKIMYRGVQVGSIEKATLTFLIDKKGRVEDLSLIQSSGSKSFDDMVLNCIRSTTFPPVPEHFGVEKYRPRGGYTVLPSY